MFLTDSICMTLPYNAVAKICSLVNVKLTNQKWALNNILPGRAVLASPLPYKYLKA